jgi:hypothetical protein
MWRMLILVPVLAVAGVLARADGGQATPVSAALVQIQDCLDLPMANPAGFGLEKSEAAGLSLRAIASTLGIGLLSILLFVPAALLSEFFIRRGDGQNGHSSP